MNIKIENIIIGFALAKLAEEQIPSIRENKKIYLFPEKYISGIKLYENSIEYVIVDEETITKENLEKTYEKEINKEYKTLLHSYTGEFNHMTMKSYHLFKKDYKEDFEYLDISKRNYGRKQMTFMNAKYSNLYYIFKNKIYKIIRTQYITKNIMEIVIENEKGNAKSIKLLKEEFLEKECFISKNFAKTKIKKN